VVVVATVVVLDGVVVLVVDVLGGTVDEVVLVVDPVDRVVVVDVVLVDAVGAVVEVVLVVVVDVDEVGPEWLTKPNGPLSPGPG
jgi:hypothetical protein